MPSCNGPFSHAPVIRDHRDEWAGERFLTCRSCGFRGRVEVSDDEDDRSVLPPGQRFAEQPNLSKFWSG